MIKGDLAQGGLSSSKKKYGLEFRVDPLQKEENHPKIPQSEKFGRHFKAGEICLHCHSTELDYDGLLNLGCPACGYVLTGCFS